MTGFEMFMLSSFCLMFTAIVIFGIIYMVKKDEIFGIINDNQRNVETNNQRVLHTNNNNGICNNGVDNLHDSNMGNNHRQVNNRQDIQPTRCYENGEITNLCTIIALKNIEREFRTMLTPIEIDAIDKAVDNTITVEKLKAFIDNVELEDIDIDE